MLVFSWKNCLMGVLWVRVWAQVCLRRFWAFWVGVCGISLCVLKFVSFCISKRNIINVGGIPDHLQVLIQTIMAPRNKNMSILNLKIKYNHHLLFTVSINIWEKLESCPSQILHRENWSTCTFKDEVKQKPWQTSFNSIE